MTAGDVGVVVEADDRKWSKPLVLLHQQPFLQRRGGLPKRFLQDAGPGQAGGPASTGGYVIGTGERAADATRLDKFRMPRIGVFTPTGVDMDRQGVQPDVLVEPHPDQLARGQDVQLEKAVEVLRGEVAEWKRSHPVGVGGGAGVDGAGRGRVSVARAPGPAASPPSFMPMAK